MGRDPKIVRILLVGDGEYLKTLRMISYRYTQLDVERPQLF